MFPNVWRTAMFVSTLATFATLDDTPGRSENALDVSFTRVIQENRTFDCGVRTSIGTPLIIGGMSAKRGEVPWHAGLYRKSTTPYEQICGGSVISITVILSAAHCFWDYFEGKQLPADQFAVAVGKLYRPWNDPHDEAQKSDVKEVHVPDYYQGSIANEQADLAVVVVVNAFHFTPHVQPVCLDFDENMDSGRMGKVAGWGYTSIDGTPSGTLQVLDIPYVDVRTCISGSPLSFRGHITSDKFCAGFKDNRTALCRGDSGSGLAFPRTARGAERFYLRGVASTAPRDNNALCNANAYTTFTHLLRYQRFITTYLDAGAYQQAPYEETEWDWSRCREETVPNSRSISSKQFHPLSAAGGGGGGRLRLAVRGDGNMWICLSREARLDTSSSGLFFIIWIGRTQAGLSAVDAGEWTVIQLVSVRTDLSSSRWTRVVLDVGAGSLEVRVGDAATLLLVQRDPRLDQIKYIGFNTNSNSDGHATFKFGC